MKKNEAASFFEPILPIQYIKVCNLLSLQNSPRTNSVSAKDFIKLSNFW